MEEVWIVMGVVLAMAVPAVLNGYFVLRDVADPPGRWRMQLIDEHTESVFRGKYPMTWTLAYGVLAVDVIAAVIRYRDNEFASLESIASVLLVGAVACIHNAVPAVIYVFRQPEVALCMTVGILITSVIVSVLLSLNTTSLLVVFGHMIYPGMCGVLYVQIIYMLSEHNTADQLRG